jgi:hypothetical protein
MTMPRNGTYHGDATLTVTVPDDHRTLGWGAVMREIIARENSTVGSEIPDAVAVAIAAILCQGALTPGMSRLALADGKPFRLEDLADDLSAGFERSRRGTGGYRALCMLATWALNHPSRSDRAPAQINRGEYRVVVHAGTWYHLARDGGAGKVRVARMAPVVDGTDETTLHYIGDAADFDAALALVVAS